MTIIVDSDRYKIYWHDDEHTILVGEVYVGWTWTDAYEGLKTFNETLGIRSNEVKVYAILDFHGGAQLLPKPGSILANLRNLLNTDPQYEEMTVYVIQMGFLFSMMQIASKLYGIRHWIDKHRFVITMEEALQIIEQEKSKSKSLNTLLQ